MKAHTLTDTHSTSLDISQETKDLKAEIALVQQQYMETLSGIEALRRDIAEFQQIYDVKVKQLYERLNHLELLLFKFNNIGDYVDDMFSFSEAEEIFEDTMKDRRARMEDETRRQKSRDLFMDKRLKMSINDRAELKKLYRTLARLFHPDKTGGDEFMMKQINRAYHEGDLEALRNMHAEKIPTKQDDTLSGLIARLAGIRRLIDMANSEARFLRKSDMYILRKNLMKKNKANTEKVLDGLSRELRKEILKREEQVERYREKFGQSEELVE